MQKSKEINATSETMAIAMKDETNVAISRVNDKMDQLDNMLESQVRLRKFVDQSLT